MKATGQHRTADIGVGTIFRLGGAKIGDWKTINTIKFKV